MTRNARNLTRSAAKPARRLPLKKDSALPALSTLALVIGSIAAPAHANPTGGNVVAGNASINDRGNGTLDINQSSGKAIINWKDFSIGANETVNFRQPGSNSVTLNRVIGNDPSAIFGRLNANGTVMLVNPNGVIFGKGARIDVGGLVATTANINDKDFLAGNYKFDQASKNLNAAIINEGTISIKDSGLAALVAPAVKNSGVIQAKLGKVALAGAKTFTVDFQGDGLLSFDASSVVDQLPKDAKGNPIGALVTNTGEIRADGGTVLMTARAVKDVVDTVINTDGVVRAQSVGTKNGKIVLSGGDAGSVTVAGTVDATGTKAGETGGKVVVTGEHVKVASTAVVDVSGAAGGGEIALGSQGVKPDDGSEAFSGKSSTVAVAKGAKLKADALDLGNGGSITMWSKDATAFAGDLSARGGANGGDGGFAEVSSKKDIGLTGSADLRASKGKTGLLLIDPTDLRIVDSNGDQDGNAGDGTISSSDPNTANNTVSRQLLESLAGNANIQLEATGLITISDMAAINLQTTSGNTFTLRSTQSGGIKFDNSNTEISTQGGNITLESLGVGAKLDNIGKLTSNGGNITLTANGDINMANAVDADSGAALVRSAEGSIRNTGGFSQVVLGNTVTLSATKGNIGDSAAFVKTQTAKLALAMGGNMAVANSQILTSLDINSRHAQATANYTYQLTSPNLQAFSILDNGGYTLNQISQSGLNFSFTGDRTITAGVITTPSGSISLTSTAGDILGTPGSLLESGRVTLNAQGSNGGNGAIGSASQTLNIATATLDATAGSGGININNSAASPLLLRNISTTGVLSATTVGTMVLGNIKASSAALTSTTGGFNDDGSADTLVSVNSLRLRAQTGIGNNAAIRSNAASIDAATQNGTIVIDATNANTSIVQATTQNNGPITITGTGALTVGNISASGGAISLSGKSIALDENGAVNAGTGSVALTATQGSITGTADSLITGNTVTLLAPDETGTYTIGTSATALRLAAGTVQARAGAIYLDTTTRATRLDSLKGYNGITVNAQANVTVNQADAGVGALTINTSEGAILGVAGNRLAGQSVKLSAATDLGNAATHLRTRTSDLQLTGGSDIYVDNVEKSLDRLDIVHTHANASVLNTLSVTSPYLEFSVADLADGYHLDKVYSTPLTTFSFSGDRDVVLGNIKNGGQITLRSTQGNIRDDGDDETRVTAGNITLAADNGSIGTSTRDVETNAAALTLITRGNLYATSVADLSSLTVEARHASAADVNALRVRAPSLLFDVLDSTDGYTLRDVRDSSSLSFSFTSDRSLTVGNIDVSSSGSVMLSSENGSLKDDSNKQTWILANSVGLYANNAVGATGSGYLDVLTANLSGNAGSGGFYVRLPRPAGYTNYTDTINLNGIYAQGDVQISASQGDLALTGKVQSYGGNIQLAANNGAITNGNGYGILQSNGSINLTALKNIGAADLTTPGGGDNNRRAILLDGTGALTVSAVTSGAQRDIYLSKLGSGTTTLQTISTSGNFNYQQASGDTVLRSVQAGTSAKLNNVAGSILDDGDITTSISSASITLASGNAVGTADRHLQVSTPSLSVTAPGSIALDNSSTFTRLDITRQGTVTAPIAITAANQTFSIRDDGSYYHLTKVESASPLEFNFTTGNKSVLVGNIDVGTAGKVSLTASNGGITKEDLADAGKIAAGQVALSAGSSYSIGSAGGALQLFGTTDLSLTAGRFILVNSDTALAKLAITSTANSATASDIIITAPDQTYLIIDNGVAHNLRTIGGAGLLDFSFTNNKNIEADSIVAQDSVALKTSGDYSYSSIVSTASGTGLIQSKSVSLTAMGSDANPYGGGTIGNTGSGLLRLSTEALKISSNGGVALQNNVLLKSLDLDLTKRYNGDTAVNSTFLFNLSGQTLGLTQNVSGTQIQGTLLGANLSLSVNSSIQANSNINLGSTGSSLTLTARDTGKDGQYATISGGGVLFAENLTLSALGRYGSIGASSAMLTSAKNLTLASTGSIQASNNAVTPVESLTIDARHSDSGQVNTYNFASSNLTFNVTDNADSITGVKLTNVTTTSDVDFSFASDRTLTVGYVQTGANGSVTLKSDGTIYGTSTGPTGSGQGTNPEGPDIVTGDLTLVANAVQGKYNEIPSRPLFVSVDTLSSDIKTGLSLSNDKNLALLNNSVGSSASVAVTSGSITQSGTGRFVTPVLSLSAQQSIGANGASVLTDTRQLSTRTGENLYLQNASNLFSLDVGISHASESNKTLSVAADGLTFNVIDQTASTLLFNIADTTGLDFTFSSDRILRMGTINVGAGHSAYLSGTSLVNYYATPPAITADKLTLVASGSIGGLNNALHTNTRDLTLVSGGNVYLGNDLDLLTLSLTNNAQTNTAVSYGITAPALTFTVTDDGTSTQLSNVSDTTGLNFTYRSNHALQVGKIDVLSSGTVSLESNKGIATLDALGSDRITAGQVALSATGNSAIGANGAAIRVTAPILSISNTGNVYVDSSKHLDSLTLYAYGDNARAYGITAPTRDHQGSLAFEAEDDGSTLYLKNAGDADGMTLNVSSSRGIKVGAINVGNDDVSLYAQNSALVDDGNTGTRILAGNLRLSGDTGIGSAGSGIDSKVDSLSANSRDGGVNLTLNGAASLQGLTGNGDSTLINYLGDLALGSINLNGHSLNIDNRGGSILSGTIRDTANVTLKAAGSIGNDSAILTYGYAGGTTNVTLTAQAANGADGSIALKEEYALNAASVTAAGNVTLTADGSNSNYSLNVGSVTAGGNVVLTSQRGNIDGNSGSNLVKGQSVTLQAGWDSFRSIGSSGTLVNVDTTSLTLNSLGSFYINSLGDLATLNIDRTNLPSGNVSGGTMLINGSTALYALDSGNTVTLNSLTDSTGLDFSLVANGTIRVGNINVTNTGAVSLEAGKAAAITEGQGGITALNASSLITAGSLTLDAGSSSSHTLGTSSQALITKVDNISATAGGGIWLKQAGTISLDDIKAGGALSVQTTVGDMLVGQLQYGAGNNLTLAADNGSIKGNADAAVIGGSGSGNVTLRAATGIGSSDAALQIAGGDKTISATVTGNGSLYLANQGALTGSLSTSVNNGATLITSTGLLNLGGLESKTDAVGNDITVRVDNGNLWTGNATAGAQHGNISLTASNGGIYASTGNVTVNANTVTLASMSDIGNSVNYLTVGGQHVDARSELASLYLRSSTSDTILSYLAAGQSINIVGQGNLQVANAITKGGDIVINGSIATANKGLTVGNINAGSGAVQLSYSYSGGTIVDDGNADTRVTGGIVTLTAGSNIGGTVAGGRETIQTTTAQLQATSTNAGAIYIDDNRAEGVTLAAITSLGGPISITTVGNTQANNVQATSNSISIASSNGDISVGQVNAGGTGSVTLKAHGDITAQSDSRTISQITANTVNLSAGGDIGEVSDLASGNGRALLLNVSSLGTLQAASSGVISLDNSGTTALTLNAVDQGDGGSFYLRTGGNLNASAGIDATNLLLQSGGTLTLAAGGVDVSGAATLIGATDVVSASDRTLHVKADSLTLSTGSAGGTTTLVSEVNTLNASQTGSGTQALEIDNTGDLDATVSWRGNATLETAGILTASNVSGAANLTLTATEGVNASSVSTTGSNATITITAENGDINIGSINGANGTVVLNATQGSLIDSALGAGINAATLQLSSFGAIGSSNAYFTTGATQVSANVLGTGGIYLEGTGPLTLSRATTADGDIHVIAADDLTVNGTLAAGKARAAGDPLTGQGGHIALSSTDGDVTLSQNLGKSAASSLAVSGATITLASVETSGQQNYDGDVTLNGDLTAGSIGIQGALTLTGSYHVLSTSSANGNIEIGGSVSGGNAYAQLTAGTGNVTLHGNVDMLSGLSINANTIQVASVKTVNGQQYWGDTTLSGTYVTTQNGSFTVGRTATLGGDVSISTGAGAVDFESTINGAHALSIDTSSDTLVKGAISVGSLDSAGTGTVTLIGGRVTTDTTQSYQGRVLLLNGITLTGSHVSLQGGADGQWGNQQLTIVGDATLGGTFGANTATGTLAGLTVDGKALLLGGDIITTGSQHFKGAVTLNSNQTLTTNSGNITFDDKLGGAYNLTVTSRANGDVTFNQIGEADTASSFVVFGAPAPSTGSIGDLTVNTGGKTSFNGEAYAQSVTTDAAGTLAINGGLIDTTSSQQYGERAVLGANTVLTGNSITLSQGADGSTAGGQSLTINGYSFINGALGANAALASLSLNGVSYLNAGTIATTGDQYYGGNVNLRGDHTLTTAAGKVTFAAKLGGEHDLTVTSTGAGDVTFNEVGASDIIYSRIGVLRVPAPSSGRLGNLTVNTAGLTSFDGEVRAASVTTDVPGTLAINGGLIDTTGTQSYGERAVLGANTELKGTTVTFNGADGSHALTVTGDAVVKGALGANTALAALTITGTADLNGGVVNTVGAQDYQGNVTLSDNLLASSGGGNVTFSGTVSSAAGAANDLTVNAGSGNVTFAGAVGNDSSARLGDLSVNSSGATTLGGAVYAASVTTDAGGTLAINGGRVDTTGAQSYGELLALSTDTELKGTTVTFNGADGSHALTVTGAAVIKGAVGANTALAALTITGNADLNGGVVNTVGAQDYQGNVTLADNLVANTRNSNVSFGGTVSSAAGAANDLTVNAGSGNVTFAGAVGNDSSARLGDIVVNSSGATTLGGAVYAASVTTDAGGTLAINGGRVDTTGAQAYGELAVLSADTELKGTTVTLNGADGNHALTVTGNAVITGALGANTALAALTITGNADLDTGVINTVGAQAYQGNVTLADNLVANTRNSNVSFGGTVASAAGAANDLTVNAGSGSVTFAGAVGNDSNARLGDIVVNSSGATTLGGAVYAASVTTDAGGTIAINGGLVDTTGAQTYKELASFGVDTVLKGSSVSLLGGGDGPHGLAIEGNATLQGTFGANSPLVSLTIDGLASLDGSIATTGDQSYKGAVTLDGDLSLATQGGNVSFDTTVASSANDAHALSVTAGAGSVSFSDAVGDATTGRLGDIIVNSSGATTLDGAVYAASVATDAGGTIAINGGLVDTSGSQSYGELASFGMDTVLKGSSVSLLNGGDGDHALTINGDATLGGTFGAIAPLASLSVSGNTTFNGGSLATSGDQSYQGTVTLAGAQTLSSASGDIGFDGAVDGSADLSVRAGGDIVFADTIGANNRLGALVIDADGDTRLAAAVRAASLSTSEAGTLSINGGSVDTTGNQTYGERAVLGADTVLTGATVTLLSGVDGSNAGQQSLHIAGNAEIHGDVGGIAALRELSIDGATSMDAGSITTTGTQTYSGAVALSGARDLSSQNGSIVFGSSLDGAGNNLSLTANADILVNGNATDLGALTLRAVDTIVFNGNVTAYRVQQLEARSASYQGKLTATDTLEFTGGSIAFGNDVSAENGSILIENTDNAGTVTFNQGATVRAATGFTQTGGAALLLPAQLLVNQGAIQLDAVARIQGSSATIRTNGDLTATGIYGPQATLNVALGSIGQMKIGLNDADLSHKLDVAVLAVPSAASAQVYGSIAGKTGPFAASLVTSPLVGSPFFLNDTVWGPTDIVNRVTATTAPRWIVPSKPSVDSLFRGTVPPEAYGPDVLNAYADPQILTVALADPSNWQLPAGDTPTESSQQPAINDAQSSENESESDAQRSL